MIRKQLARTLNSAILSPYDFAEASHLTAVEADESYDFVREFRGTFKEAYQLIDNYYHPEQDLESGMTLDNVVDKLPHRIKNRWGMKVYKMAPRRATLGLALWLDEYSVGEIMLHNSEQDLKHGKQNLACLFSLRSFRIHRILRKTRLIFSSNRRKRKLPKSLVHRVLSTLAAIVRGT